MSSKEIQETKNYESSPPQPAKSKQEHFIIAIGASAGGLEAIHDFFDNARGTTNVSYVVIQHLSPDHKSLLVELVAKHTHMKVYEAEHNMRVEKNCIYVIPPKMLMTIKDGHLQLSEKKADKTPNTAIDTFLFSLAEERGERAIVVILSGTGTDGTKGAEAIKQQGGMVLVQDPESAKFDGMPRNAIGSGNADLILAPQQMPDEINNYVQDIPVKIFEDGKVDEDLMDSIFKVVYHHTGCDFHYYKLPTLLRRISRRMGQLKLKNVNDYIAYLHKTPEESKILCKDFLIGVTRFFRDQPAFDILTNKVLPDIVKNKTEGENIKIWVTACSTGEEAYTMAMLVDSYLKKVSKTLTIKIFATDIDAQAIETAARGEYNSNAIKDLPYDIVSRYFIKEGNKYIITPELRKCIVFARHNIINDPPFIKNDLVSCRNMLIYMNSELQKKVLTTLHFSLNAGGYLFLGSSETVSSIQGSLEEIDRKWKIYRKGENVISRPIYHLDGNRGNSVYTSLTSGRTLKPAKSAAKGLEEDFKSALTEEHGYAALYIDKNYYVKEATGNFRKYLSLPEQGISLNLLKMVSTGLGTTLGSAIRKAWKEGRKVSVRRAMTREEGKTVYIDVLVKPENETNHPYTLIVFSEVIDEHTAVSYKSNGHEKPSDEQEHYIEELKSELKETKLNLQATIESLETANEELQSSNEELLSSNEELQSSNEELQSLNEELHTLNTEHQAKINELIELTDDLNNYFRSVTIGQVFLDRDLRIRKFNPAATKQINLIESDIGRPFSNISTNIKHEHLDKDLESVLRTGEMEEREITMNDGRMGLMRIYPYLRRDKEVDGLVLTFVDITNVKDLHNIIDGIFNASQNAIMALHAVRDEKNNVIDFKWVAANDATEKIYNKGKDEFVGKRLKQVFPQVEEKGLFEKYVQVLHSGKPLHMEYPVKCDGKEGWWDVVAVKMGDGLTVTFTDITEKKEQEEKLRNSYNELIVAKEELKKLNSQLENKVQERTKELSESEERFRLVSKATNDGIWDWDLVNNNIWWSDSFFELLGYKKEDNLMRVDFRLDNIHPDDRNRVKKSLFDVINNSEAKSQWSEEYRFRRADGSYATVFDRGYVLHDEYGTPYRMIGSMLDVSDLRRVEQEVIENIEQRKFMAESMPLIVWTATPVGKITFLNRNFASYSGMTVKQGREFGWQAIVQPEDLAKLKQAWRKAIQKKNDFSVEVRLRKKDGSYCWHLLRARAKKDANGSILMWVGTNTDIHEQKMAAEIMEHRVNERTQELQQANRELEISNHDLQQFASVASHDLKEPLRKIHMFSNMLKDRFLKDADTGVVAYVDRIINSSARMTRLINDLLNFSRLSVDTGCEPTDLNNLIDEVLADLELTIQEKNAVITKDPLPVIDAISGQLRQVFQNIISNALKFSKPDEHPVVSIKAERIEALALDAQPSENGKYLKLTIADNGIGFDKQYAEKIFTLFQRLHTKQEYEGTGIGLAICKKIIDKHGGLISARSEEHKGAEFTIILPFHQG